MQSTSEKAFFALVRAGLWEKDVRLSHLECIDFTKVYRLAEEQSVTGLLLAGIEHSNVKPPQDLLLQWIGDVQFIEQRNQAMNIFIAGLVDKMRVAGINTVLVKGQGVAQCYERPLWRSSGDVDLFLSKNNYKTAKDFLLPLASNHKSDHRYSKHLGMTIDPWYVEIHGTLRTGLSGRIDKVVDEVQRAVFCGEEVRSWDNNGTTVFLPSPDNDVFFVFTHYIKHFYKEGMNLRQICDWCRLLWKFKESLNHSLLKSRIRKAGMLDEWNAFAALAVDYLGMPADAMPLYEFKDSGAKKKGERLLNHILKGGPYNKVRDTWAIAKIFPWHTLKFVPSIFFNVNGLKIKERLFGE